MTTIAYRDGVIAADSLISMGDVRAGSVVKIVRVPGGGLAGAAGELGGMYRFLEWAHYGGEETTADFAGCEIDGFLVRPDGTLLVTDSLGGVSPIKAPFHAVGSGRELALGAMAAGADAVEAVKIAVRFDTRSGGPVKKIALRTQ